MDDEEKTKPVIEAEEEKLDANTVNFSQSKYIRICEADGQEKFVRKSSIVWLLSDSTKKLSNDRLKRVQMVSSETAKRTKTTIPLTETCSELSIGQWVICWSQPEDDNWDLDWKNISEVPFEKILENIVIGAVLAFRYSGGKNDKEKQCRMDTVLVTKNQTNNASIRTVDISATWYKVAENGLLLDFINNNFFMSSNQYIGTIEKKFVNINAIANKLSVDVSHVKQKLVDPKK